MNAQAVVRNAESVLMNAQAVVRNIHWVVTTAFAVLIKNYKLV
jgi:hypothetical protein